MKRKFLLPILSVCMVVALVSVGFAAWLITGNDVSDTANGNFVTYDVSNEFFTVTVNTATDETGKIIFGKPADDKTDAGYQAPETTNTWLSMQDVDEQDLEATFTVTVTPADNTKKVPTLLGGKSVYVTLKSLDKKVGSDGNLTDATANPFDTLAGEVSGTRKALVAYPTLKYGANDAVSIANGNTLKDNGVVLEIPATAFEDKTGAQSVDITITFNWGAEFTQAGETQPSNPYVFYNNQAVNADLATKANSYLKAIYDLNSYAYELGLSVDTANS